MTEANRPAVPVHGTAARATTFRGVMVRLAHVSDLHFGAADADALAQLGRALEDASPDAIVVTGDVTQSGRRREFREAATFLTSLTRPLMVIPGNHDAPVYAPLLRFAAPWRRFRRILNCDIGAVLDVDGLRVIGLNSARRAGAHVDWSRGRLSRRQIVDAAAAARSAPVGALRVVALHHPVLASDIRPGRTVVARARDALLTFSAAGVDLVLAGHVHRARATIHATERGALVVVQAGTASSTRTRGEAPSFNLIDGDRRGVSVSVRLFDGGGYCESARTDYAASPEGWTASRVAVDAMSRSDV